MGKAGLRGLFEPVSENRLRRGVAGRGTTCNRGYMAAFQSRGRRRGLGTWMADGGATVSVRMVLIQAGVPGSAWPVTRRYAAAVAGPGQPSSRRKMPGCVLSQC